MTFIIFIGYDRKQKAQRRRLPDNMFCNTCKSTLLHMFLETPVLRKSLSLIPPTYKVELGISWLSIYHRNIDNHFSYGKVSCLKSVLRKRRYAENLLLKYTQYIKKRNRYFLADNMSNIKDIHFNLAGYID